MFCRVLSKSHEVHVTNWIAEFSHLRDYLSRDYLRILSYRRWRDDQVTVHQIPRISPAIFSPALIQFNAYIFSRYLKWIIRREQIDVVVGTFVAPPPQVDRLVFDVFDDNVRLWQSTGRSEWYGNFIARTEKEYLARADHVVAASSVLADRLHAAGYARRVATIPNGVHVRDYSAIAGATTRHALGLEGLVVGLVGNLDRPDELLLYLNIAETLRTEPITFVIIGRGAAVPASLASARARNLRNVRFLGFVEPERVAAYVAAIDVGVCPYALGEASDARSPMRLLAHSAAGSTVVCSKIEEVRRMDFENVMLVDRTPHEFARAVMAASGKPRRRPARMPEYELDVLVARYESVLLGENAMGVDTTASL